ncbi:hypothetical protein OC861_003123 [Tilletia horrida]|nr:hypothetical protein OC861_003123 [Tilletia horrida]
MGASSSKQPPPPPPPPLAPVPPIGLYPQCTTHPEEMALIVRQKFSGDYYAKDAVTGQQVFTIRSKDFSFSRSNKIEDAPRTRSNTRRPKIDGFDSRSFRPGAGPPPPVLKVEFRSETSADVMFRDRCSPAGAEQDVVLLLETNYTCDRGTIFLSEGRPLARMQPSHRRSYETLLSVSTGMPFS